MINYNIFLPWITLKITAINAITSSMCIMDPALYAKNPIAQKMTSITATV
jgi:hypothetical protein